MRKLLLATAAVVGASVGTMGLAAAQTAMPVQSLQGNVATPANGNFASVYGDGNYMSGTATKGPVANPTPGTMVIRLGLRFDIEASGTWSNLNQYSQTAAGAAAATAAGSAGSGNTVATGKKISPIQFEEYVRIYPGMDAMAANGLRYGAAVEIRQNFPVAPQSEVGANGGTGYTSGQTLYVRRAFAYVGSDQWGIVRMGEMDGLIGTFDEGGATTGVFLAPSGTIVGGDLEGSFVSNATMTPYFAAQSGNEYGNDKVVYLSPSIAGFDVGFQYAPNPFNGFGSQPYDYTAPGGGADCPSAAGTFCQNLGSSTTALSGSLAANMYAAGIRYQGTFGPAAVLAYGVYMGSGHTNYTGGTISTGVNGGKAFSGQFDNLSLGMFGANVNVAGLTVFGNVMFGAYNGVLALKPAGAPDAVGFGAGAKYAFGPYTVGAVCTASTTCRAPGS